MAIRIETQKPEIPVEIGKLKFSFDVSDDALKRLRTSAAEVQKEIENLKNKGDEHAEKSAREALQKGYDLLLGEGTFAKVYEQTPSLHYVMEYYVKLADGIEKELKALGKGNYQQEKAQKYLNKRKHRPKNR
ncbi:hypothetical protein BC6307_17915 [Sutcliffiella cohnii]|uniref:Uncharacterized protein n=1 Tax=Sutcliffiella cohnii TaxID=33932 RepID=A0A223KUG1_9BACI|nr:hypothetical protein [Sutcliffiella cohnii]AST93004.1 hypothetical protein BC6307_17915 [Sutcliffiella cohnii]